MYRLYTLLCLGLLTLVPSALAVLSGDDSPPVAVPGDPDQEAGLAAWRREDWHGVIEHMTRVIARRPWDDNAYNRLGFAYRKLGDYRQAVAHYQRALALNPYHRGALEYLGEAYLEQGCLPQARDLLSRLEHTCRRVLTETSGDGWQAGCKEWRELHAAITAYGAPARSGCRLQ
jgi:tetratricopeptide (TPR) repeat protein